MASPLVLLTLPKNQKLALVLFEKYDATCKQTMNTSTDNTSSSGLGATGTVIVDSFSTKEGATVSGTLDVTFGAGDHMKGTFNATVCDASKADTSAATTCK